MKAIRDFVVGESVTCIGYVKSAQVLEAKSTKKPYISLTIADASGEISTSFFNNLEIHMKQLNPLSVFTFTGKVGVYKDKPQLNDVTYVPNPTPVYNLVKRAPVSPDSMLDMINRVMHDIGDLVIFQVVRYSLNKVEEKLKEAPAAKGMHHDYYGGLLYHMCYMLYLADYMCKLHKELNPNLLKGAVIMHDLAKPVEMISNLGVVSDYSFKGKLIGHINIAYGWTIEAAMKLNLNMEDERFILLQHCILAHHNLGEWGSPVQPQCPEAVVLHYIDQLNAKTQMAIDAIKSTSDANSWTDRVYGLENKAMYKSNQHFIKFAEDK